MKGGKIILFIMAFTLYGNLCSAQGGGPPMITDDPGVVDLHKWELNTSFNLSISHPTQISFPYVDLNYGIVRNVHLKMETGYLFSFDKNHTSSKLDQVSLGLKYNFLKEDKSFLSVGIYPQITITGDEKNLLFPLLLEKTIGKFVIGEDIGFSFGENNYQSFQNGILLGYQMNDKFEIMGEYFMEKNISPNKETSAYMNYGFRYYLNKNFSLLGSFGRQIITPPNEPQEYFISYIAIQSRF